jgi:dTDP-4-dehydrorhamnose 3,5-epimerase-like enzyme
VRSYRLVQGSDGSVLGKVRRRFRRDSWRRKLVSIAYNGLMWGIFGQLGAIDLNGSPKVFSQEAWQQLALRSKDWFLDPEIMIKARHLRLTVEELNVQGLARAGGTSNVRIRTILEFLKNIFRYRFGAPIVEWKRGLPAEPITAPGGAMRDEPDRLDGVRVLDQRRFEDARGFLQGILGASQCHGSPPRGEVYVTAARPGEVKGNHFHLGMGEWFAVVQGEATLELADPESGARRSIPLGASRPRTVYVPAGVAHALVNRGTEPIVCVAWAEREHDPADVHPFAAAPTA